MFIFFVGLTMFIMGAVAGYMVSTRAYDMQPWEMYGWSKASLGYRPIPLGRKLMRNDNIIMALKLNTESFPEEGLEYSFEYDEDE